MPILAGASLSLPKLAQALLDDFGRAVKLARAKRGWELNDLANRIAEMEAGRTGQKAKAPARTFLSDIEKGKRSISPPTVGKLIHALGLPESWLEQFLQAAPDDADEVTQADQDADRLLQMAARDASLPPTAEGLLIGLAQSYAGGNYIDHFTAYAAVKSALEAAQAMKAQGNLPSNTDSQLDAVLREVARLNDQGEFEAAAQALDAEFARTDAALESVVQRQLDQDRILNRPKAAADRLIAQLKRQAPAGGVFKATRELKWEYQERGSGQSKPFDLSVAYALAKRNLDRAKRPNEKSRALADFASIQQSIGERSADDTLLLSAEENFRTTLKVVSRKLDPGAWTELQGNLGTVLMMLGDRRRDPKRLTDSVAALGQAILEHNADRTSPNWTKLQSNLGVAIHTLGELEGNPVHLLAAIDAHERTLLQLNRVTEPDDWAGTQNNIGLARRWLGSLTGNQTQLEAARIAFDLSLEGHSRNKAPFHWATTQWNLADLALARFDLTGDRALLKVARTHALAAREVFVEGSDHQTAECDRLLAQIDAA
jgi:transcriptional regulator with XRE-family HTH domain